MMILYLNIMEINLIQLLVNNKNNSQEIVLYNFNNQNKYKKVNNKQKLVKEQYKLRHQVKMKKFNKIILKIKNKKLKILK